MLFLVVHLHGHKLTLIASLYSVFEESVGSMFVHCVKSNLARWIEEGSRATELMMKEDEKERSSRPNT